jgi:hypothetical protein
MLEWPEYDFFRTNGGLSSNTDGVEMEICYDYELARCSQKLVQRILAWDDRQRVARSLVQDGPYQARSAWLLEKDDVGENPIWRPWVPTAALLASWFPDPWLCGPAPERKNVVELLGRSYWRIGPLRFDPYPPAPEKENLRRQAIEWDNSRSRNFERYVLEIDWTQPLTRIKRRFALWLTENNPTNRRQIWCEAELAKIEHLKGIMDYDKLVADVLRQYPLPAPVRSGRMNTNPRLPLERLACYRLSGLPSKDRKKFIVKLEWLKAENIEPKISRAKRAVLRDLKTRFYLD